MKRAEIIAKTDWKLDDEVLPNDLNLLGHNFEITKETLVELNTLIQTWVEFKKNGGTINEHLIINTEKTENAHTKYAAVGRFTKRKHYTMQLNDENNVEVSALIQSLDSFAPNPKYKNLISLGLLGSTFKDLWLGSFSRQPNGYTKLPNGLFLQWGEIYKSGSEAKQNDVFMQLPIAFETHCLTGGATHWVVDIHSNPRAIAMNFLPELSSIRARWSSSGLPHADTIHTTKIFWWVIGY